METTPSRGAVQENTDLVSMEDLAASFLACIQHALADWDELTPEVFIQRLIDALADSGIDFTFDMLEVPTVKMLQDMLGALRGDSGGLSRMNKRALKETFWTEWLKKTDSPHIHPPEMDTDAPSRGPLRRVRGGDVRTPRVRSKSRSRPAASVPVKLPTDVFADANVAMSPYFSPPDNEDGSGPRGFQPAGGATPRRAGAARTASGATPTVNDGSRGTSSPPRGNPGKPSGDAPPTQERPRFSREASRFIDKLPLNLHAKKQLVVFFCDQLCVEMEDIRDLASMSTAEEFVATLTGGGVSVLGAKKVAQALASLFQPSKAGRFTIEHGASSEQPLAPGGPSVPKTNDEMIEEFAAQVSDLVSNARVFHQAEMPKNWDSGRVSQMFEDLARKNFTLKLLGDPADKGSKLHVKLRFLLLQEGQEITAFRTHSIGHRGSTEFLAAAMLRLLMVEKSLAHTLRTSDDADLTYFVRPAAHNATNNQRRNWQEMITLATMIDTLLKKPTKKKKEATAHTADASDSEADDDGKTAEATPPSNDSPSHLDQMVWNAVEIAWRRMMALAAFNYLEATGKQKAGGKAPIADWWAKARALESRHVASGTPATMLKDSDFKELLLAIAPMARSFA